MTAMEADAIERKKKRKNPDPGFSDYEQATARQYNRMISNMKVDMNAYERQKEKLGKAFYAEANTFLHDKIKDSKEGIDKMVDDLEKQYVFFFIFFFLDLNNNFQNGNHSLSVELQNVISSVEGEHIMMKQTLITSMREI